MLQQLEGLENKSENTIKDIVYKDYLDLIDLRNRIAENGELYEEDHFTLDHILDYIEIFMKEIGVE